MVVGLDVPNRFIGVTGDEGTLDAFLYRYYELNNPYHRNIATWQIIADSAVINVTNNTVDGDGSNPDPYLCLDTVCTSTAQNT